MVGGNPPAVNFIELLVHSKKILTGNLWDFLTDFEENKLKSERFFSYFVFGRIKVTEPVIYQRS